MSSALALISTTQGATKRMSQIKSSKKRRRCQEQPSKSRDSNALAFFAELDEDIILAGPRLFEDEYYDDTKEVNTGTRSKKNGNDNSRG